MYNVDPKEIIFEEDEWSDDKQDENIPTNINPLANRAELLNYFLINYVFLFLLGNIMLNYFLPFWEIFNFFFVKHITANILSHRRSC